MLESLESHCPPTPGGQSGASAGSHISLKHLAADHPGARRSSALFSHIQSLAIPALPLMPTCCNRLDLYILNGRKNLPVKKNVTISAKIGSKGWTFLLKTVVICVAHLKSDSAQPNLQSSASKHHHSSAFPKKISVVENKNAVSLTYVPDSWLGFALQDQCTANVFPWSFYKSHW